MATTTKVDLREWLRLPSRERPKDVVFSFKPKPRPAKGILKTQPAPIAPKKPAVVPKKPVVDLREQLKVKRAKAAAAAARAAASAALLATQRVPDGKPAPYVRTIPQPYPSRKWELPTGVDFLRPMKADLSSMDAGPREPCNLLKKIMASRKSQLEGAPKQKRSRR